MKSPRTTQINNHLLIAATIKASALISSVNAAPHVHGHGELTLVIENNLVEVAFNAPAESIVGFEHKPANDAEKHHVKSIYQDLHKPLNFFNFSQAQCKVVETSIDFGALTPTDEHEHHGHEHRHDHHDKHHHDEHDHHGHHDDSTHSEVEAHYRFECANIGKLNVVTLNIFEHFPSLEQLEAIWLVPQGQGANTLTSKQNKIIIN